MAFINQIKATAKSCRRHSCMHNLPTADALLLLLLLDVATSGSTPSLHSLVGPGDDLEEEKVLPSMRIWVSGKEQPAETKPAVSATLAKSEASADRVGSLQSAFPPAMEFSAARL